MKRLAVVAYHSSPLIEPGMGDAGGMTVYVRQLARSLAHSGAATDIFTRAASDQTRPTVVHEGVRVIPIEAGPPTSVPKDELTGYVEDFAAGVRSFAIANRIRYDLVHSHYWQSGLAAAGLAAAWDAPFVHSAHTLAKVKNRYIAEGDAPEPLARIEGESRVIAAADVLVTSTDVELEHMACLYGASHDRLKTIHPGVDHAAFFPGSRSDARAALGWESERPVMLFVGRIQRLKGLELAVRALSELAPALPQAPRLVIVGGASGSDGDAEIARLGLLAASLGLDELVSFLGPQPHSQLTRFYRAADVVVICSHSESFGLAALEAQASGISVVGTAVGGLSHIVKDGVSGYLVEDRDPSAFAAALKEILSDEDRRDDFGHAATQRARRFSWESTAASFLELYECLELERLPEACVC